MKGVADPETDQRRVARRKEKRLAEQQSRREKMNAGQHLEPSTRQVQKQRRRARHAEERRMAKANACGLEHEFKPYVVKSNHLTWPPKKRFLNIRQVPIAKDGWPSRELLLLFKATFHS